MPPDVFVLLVRRAVPGQLLTNVTHAPAVDVLLQVIDRAEFVPVSFWTIATATPAPSFVADVAASSPEGKTMIAGMIAKGIPQVQATQNLQDRVIQRQLALEQAGFSPGTVREAGQYDTSNAYGKFATYMPLYYAEGGPQGAMWQPADLREYLGFTPGTLPTRENLSTENQRTIYNNVEDLLGELDRIQTDEPFKAAQAGAEVERFLTEEESLLSERETTLKGAAKDWGELVHKMRKKYEKAKSKSVWGSVARIVLGVGTLGGSELLRATGLPGSKLPEKLVGKALQGTVGKVPGVENLAEHTVGQIPLPDIDIYRALGNEGLVGAGVGGLVAGPVGVVPGALRVAAASLIGGGVGGYKSPVKLKKSANVKVPEQKEKKVEIKRNKEL